jgi:hypothetical protein
VRCTVSWVASRAGFQPAAGARVRAVHRPGSLTPASQSRAPRFCTRRLWRLWKPSRPPRKKSPASLRSWPAGSLSTATNTGAPQNRHLRTQAEPTGLARIHQLTCVLAYQASSAADLAPKFDAPYRAGLHDRPRVDCRTRDLRLRTCSAPAGQDSAAWRRAGTGHHSYASPCRLIKPRPGNGRW